MTKKVDFFDKRIIELYGKIISIITTVLSLTLIFIEIPETYNKVCIGIIFIILLIVTYIFIWLYANKLTHVNLNIEGSTVKIITGDLFKQSGLKVIPFNEYFDTQVDNRIISERSLNGQFVKSNYPDPNILNEKIKSNKDLNIDENIISENIEREGNTTKYKLGSTIIIDDYVLTAFSKFTKKNKAQLTMYEYLNFLLYFWDEINRVYAGNSVSVPIFGSGITRFKNGFEDIDDNELLNIMIWTFKVSKIKFKLPAQLIIVIHEQKINKINVFKLKEAEK